MKLNYKNTFFIGLAFMSICAFWQLYDNIIPLILQNTFGLKETVVGTVMAMDNMIAIFLIPVFGTLSDKINTKIGKRTPFIILGTMVAVLSMILLPIADRRGNFILFVIILAIVLIAMGSYRSPAVALMPDLTPKPLRSKANAVINLMGAAGGVFTLIMIRFLIANVVQPDYLPVFLSVVILMIVAVILLVITINEKKLAVDLPVEVEVKKKNGITESTELPKDVKKSLYFILLSIFLWFMAYNAITTAFSRYANVVWGLQGGNFANALLVATVVAIFSFIPIGFLSSKLGRKKMIMSGIILITVAYFAGAMIFQYSPIINLFFGLIGIGWAAINVNSYPMVVEMSKGTELGKYTGLYYTISMGAQSITPIISGFLLENISYRVLFPYAVIFSGLSFCTMIFVKHGDQRPERKTSILENFDTDD